MLDAGDRVVDVNRAAAAGSEARAGTSAAVGWSGPGRSVARARRLRPRGPRSRGRLSGRGRPRAGSRSPSRRSTTGSGAGRGGWSSPVAYRASPGRRTDPTPQRGHGLDRFRGRHLRSEGRVPLGQPGVHAHHGLPPEEIVGRPLSILKSGVHDKAFYACCGSTILAGQVWRGEIVNRHRDGHLYSEEQTISPCATRPVRSPTSWPSSRTSPRGGAWRRACAPRTRPSGPARGDRGVAGQAARPGLRDPLTGVLNRRYLAETLGAGDRRARPGQPGLRGGDPRPRPLQAGQRHLRPRGGRPVLRRRRRAAPRAHAGAATSSCRYGGEEFVS